MKPVAEQVETVLTKSDSVRAWAIEQLPKGITMEDRHFGHFISAEPKDFESYILRFGFDASLVSIGKPTEEHYCIDKIDNNVQVYYVERGKMTNVEYFKTHSEAEKRVLRKLVRTVYVDLSYAYRDKHYPGQDMSEIPELHDSYSKFENAWPDGSPVPL